jgi:N-acetylneuraminic acid mutarotase
MSGSFKAERDYALEKLYPALIALRSAGGREYVLSWTDGNGNLWLFGGLLASSTEENYFNDLWKFDPATSEWVWISGSSTVGSNCLVISTINHCGRSGTYGTPGTPAAGNTPGGRYQAATWVDLSGNFWMYGGLGFDATGNWGALNDLWQFNPSSNEWAWMGGSSTFGSSAVHGTYGVLGMPAAGNIPGSRWSGATWTDANGNFWLFGGDGYDASDPEGHLNDLWEFNPSTGQWAWMGGSSTLDCASLPQFGCHQPFVENHSSLGVATKRKYRKS